MTFDAQSPFARATAQLEERVDRTLTQCQRFEALCQPLAQWARRWPTQTLARWLHLEHLSREDREHAMVALALQATDAAGAALDAYQPASDDHDHQTFHQIARIEWEERRQSRAPLRRTSG